MFSYLLLLMISKKLWTMLGIAIILEVLLFTVLAKAQEDPIVEAFKTVIFENHFEMKFETYGSISPLSIYISKSIDGGEWRNYQALPNNLELNDRFNIYDTLFHDGSTNFYEIYRITEEGSITMKQITIYDGETTISVYPSRTISNLVIKTSEDLIGRVKITDVRGDSPIDNEMIIKKGKLIISEIPPGSYLLELNNSKLQTLIPIHIY